MDMLKHWFPHVHIISSAEEGDLLWTQHCGLIPTFEPTHLYSSNTNTNEQSAFVKTDHTSFIEGKTAEEHQFHTFHVSEFIRDCNHWFVPFIFSFFHFFICVCVLY